MTIITSIVSRMILDSRGIPTVEVDLTIDKVYTGRASAPSGASTGSREALEKRDGDAYFNGKGVECVLESIDTTLKNQLLNKHFSSQRDFDNHLLSLDGTDTKARFGANALLPLSLAFAKASALMKNILLYEHLREEFSFTYPASIPTPLINVLNGGKHAPHSTDIQEWMIVPLSKTSFKDSLEMSARVFYTLKEIMNARGVSGVGDEGGFPITNAKQNKEALLILIDAIRKVELIPGKDIAFAIDVAASELYKDEEYHLAADRKHFSSEDMQNFLSNLIEHFPILSIEDGFDENDWSSWKSFTQQHGQQLQIVGDDLFTTNVQHITRGVTEGAANTVLIKPNQIGTVSETVDAIEYAHKHDMRTIISHRSGETEDVSIVHFAVASGAGQVKIGSLSRTDRLSKYNELLRLSEKGLPFSRPFLHLSKER
jgi:enolase